ncbi:hypothetical protein BDR07DRAFT_1486571 [Suillus spraguei]|nr:hypothetical protein BDR07DRAFT_1486571 [Suillus spraguei]
MNVAGPSRLRGPRPVPSPTEREDHEENLTRMGASRKGPSDREVAFTLLMENARELAEFNADLELAQRLAVDGDEEPDPTHSPQQQSSKMLRSKPASKSETKSKIQKWGQLLDSRQVTPDPGQAPTVIMTRAPR